MTVTAPDLYGNRLERKNIPPPISIPNYNQLHHLQALGVPKSAPVRPSNNDFMQFHLLMESANKTPTFQQHHHPQLQHQFSMPTGCNNYSPSTPGPCSSSMSPLDAVLSCNNGGSGAGGAVQDQDQGNNGSGSSSLPRYKTELCRPFEESGSCKYGEKCQFAHGIQELRNLSRHPKYKTDLCRTFHTIGFCPYGPRCHFIHNTEEKRQPPISPGPHNSGANATLQNLPALLSILQQTNSLNSIYSINKFMALFSKVQMQLSSKDDILQYLNINTALQQHTPPTTPLNNNMFNFANGPPPSAPPRDQYIIPAASLNQARAGPASANTTSNIHSYFNFSLALKDQQQQHHQTTPTMMPPPSVPPMFYQQQSSPAVTPPLSSTSGIMSSAASMMTSSMMSAGNSMLQQHQLPSNHPGNHHHHNSLICTPQMSPVLHTSGGDHSPGSDRSSNSSGSSSDAMYLQYHGYHGYQQIQRDQLSTEYMVPGRVIGSRGENTATATTGTNKANGGKRLPIFNQLSISDPVC